jgi:hypothetical protein
MFLLRALPFRVTHPQLQVFDQRLRDSLNSRLSLPHPLPTSALLAHSQPIGNGGRGFRSLALIAAAAKWASATAVSFDIQHLADAAPSPLPFMVDRAAAHRALIGLGVESFVPSADDEGLDPTKLPLDAADIVGYYGSSPSVPGLQRALSLQLEKVQLTRFFESSDCNPADIVRFCSTKNKYTARWLATTTLHRHLSNKVVSLAVRLRDGLPPASWLPTHCRLGACKADLAVNPWHCLSCPAVKCKSIYRRHNAVVNLLLRFARSHSSLAHPMKKDLSDRLPDGILYSTDRTVMFDVSGVSPTCPSYSHLGPGEAISGRERSKTTKYYNFARDRGAAFVPFVLDCFGSLGTRAMALLDSIVEESTLDANFGSRMSKSAFLTLLSVTWQAGNAAIFAEWSRLMREATNKRRPLPHRATVAPSAVPARPVSFEVSLPRRMPPSSPQASPAAATADATFVVTLPTRHERHDTCHD